ncbi:MAG: c-type cytochrome domain-containing protein [Ginsengibacter sp.]
MILTITEFIGHLHPALVHLPIGILLIALLLIWLSHKPQYGISPLIINIVLLSGAISAALACVTGYLLSLSDDYDTSLVNWHMWMGISVAFVSFLLYIKIANRKIDLAYKILSIALLILIFVTGHLGGQITHGVNFLSLSLITNEDSIIIDAKPIINVQEAKVYRDIVQPILYKDCYGCHGPAKKKGGLRLDNFAFIMKGGKDGEVIDLNNADSSEMIRRLLLPKEDDDHMPPKQKPQPNVKQIALLHWWIQQGADTGKLVKDLQQPEKLKPILLGLQRDHIEIKAPGSIPKEAVEKADVKAIDELKAKGVIVIPVAQNSNYLMVNFVTAAKIGDNDLALLLPIKKQLVWLKIGDTNISDSALSYIGQCVDLTLLQLNNTNISDKGLPLLKGLQRLHSLNLVGTKVSAQGITELRGLKKLQFLYLYQTKVAGKDWVFLKQQFPKTMLDTGGYVVPILESDTTLVKFNVK